MYTSNEGKEKVSRFSWEGSLSRKVFLFLSRSLGMKLMLVVSSLMILVPLIIGVISYNTSLGVIERNAVDTKTAVSQIVASNLNGFLTVVESSANSVAKSETVVSLIDGIMSENSEDVYDKNMETLNGILSTTFSSNSAVRGATIFPLEKGVRVQFGGVIQYKVDEFLKTEYGLELSKVSSTTFWIPTQQEGFITNEDSPAFGIAKVFYVEDNLYFLVVEVDYNALYDRVSVVSDGYTNLEIIEAKTNNVVASTGLGRVGYALGFEDINFIVGETSRVVIKDEEYLTSTEWIPVSDWRLVVYLEVDELLNGSDKIFETILYGLVISIIVAVLLGFYIIRFVGRSISDISNILTAVSTGDLAQKMSKTNRVDEVGKLHNATLTMISTLRNLAKRLTDTSKTVYKFSKVLGETSKVTANSAREVAIATEEIAKGASTLATETEQASDTVTETLSSVEGMLEQTRSIHSVIEVTKSSADDGKKDVADLVAMNEQTKSAIISLSDNVMSLSVKLKEIDKVLKMMTEISTTTNILSLNASIEAARAGQHGKGFQVIAEEVRNLSVESASAIKTVEGITKEIMSRLGVTLGSLHSVVPLFSKQQTGMERTNDAFQLFSDNMNSVVSKLESFVGRVNAFSDSQTVLSEGFMNVSAVAQQSSATSEEVASLASEQDNVAKELVTISEKLDELSKALLGEISVFRL